MLMGLWIDVLISKSKTGCLWMWLELHAFLATKEWCTYIFLPVTFLSYVFPGYIEGHLVK
jgi:hypothetical protein